MHQTTTLFHNAADTLTMRESSPSTHRQIIEPLRQVHTSFSTNAHRTNCSSLISGHQTMRPPSPLLNQECRTELKNYTATHPSW